MENTRHEAVITSLTQTGVLVMDDWRLDGGTNGNKLPPMNQARCELLLALPTTQLQLPLGKRP
jgi:hypothetical protein